jgi:alpha-galactosidase
MKTVRATHSISLHSRIARHACFAVAWLLVSFSCLAGQVWLDQLPLDSTVQDWGQPQRNKSVGEHPITLGGVKHDHGFGTHAKSVLQLSVNGQAKRFAATVGVDDEESSAGGSVEFSVIGDGKTLWKSGILRGGGAPTNCDVSLEGVNIVTLMVGDAGDGIEFDHADWADASFDMTGDARPTAFQLPPEPAEILTPKTPPTPQIHGATVFGVRPGAPLLFHIAATGDGPIKYSAIGLPAGLQLDENTGIITGQLPKPGKHVVTLKAKNSLGSAKRKLTIICGPQIGLTPAMGWNSWNCFAGAVSAEKVKAATDAMVASGLINHGWTYINIDDFWETHRNSKDPTLQGPARDDQGRILPNPRFPDMKGLADYVHSKGLKIGLYSSPGPWTCGGCVGSFDHEEQDAKQYGDWGFDYLKYDWCSYHKELEAQRGASTNSFQKMRSNGAPFPPDREGIMRPYAIMRAALDKVNRDIIYSLCQYGNGNVWEWGTNVGGNSWRTTGDIVDTWGSMTRIGFSQNGHEKFAGPGHFNDPDMLVVGKVGWGHPHPTRLSPNEQYTHMSLWCLQAAPLLIGCDMTQLDDFTLSLLTNDEVLDVDQDPLARPAGLISKQGDLEIWARDLEDGSKAVGLFNRGAQESQVTVAWADLKISSGKHLVRDLWRQKDLGKFKASFTANVPRHGVVLIKVK